jgi:hypothetical protein
MSDEKIRVTSEEIAGANISATAQPPAAPRSLCLSQPGVVERASTGPNFRPFLLAIPVVLVIAALLIGGSYWLSGRQSVETWERREREVMNREMSNSKQIKEYIEEIHPLVTYTGATVKTMDVTTLDGSSVAGRNGSNISEVVVVVTYYWEGPVQRNGYTDVRYDFDFQAGKLRSAEFLDSNAEINLANINWFGVGYALGALIFGGK